MGRPASAIPDFYYALFAFYEPALTLLGFIGALHDPVTTHNTQAPWPVDSPAPDVLPKASVVTVIQLAHVCALMGIVNFFVLTAIRKHLALQPALQEKIMKSLMIPLLIGDGLHLYVTLWALGEERWDVVNWSPMLWTTIVLGTSLMIPRIMWHLGIWRYVDARDGKGRESSSASPAITNEKN
ncbi:hypothetical protein BJ138DRAFT_1144306 [Hygrophoropsis aurantiaca]|uniref:Uncharacterized protein n=1 Tax=Hygrophoropsis aurantiaca TaxID=72124 RepID=A0ACB8AKW7_9AGAM|nr:hypothetical protein BJ138DRAFT_1144306 [Hygrophoropsis aurantiaca]